MHGLMEENFLIETATTLLAILDELIASNRAKFYQLEDVRCWLIERVVGQIRHVSLPLSDNVCC